MDLYRYTHLTEDPLHQEYRDACWRRRPEPTSSAGARRRAANKTATRRMARARLAADTRRRVAAAE